MNVRDCNISPEMRQFLDLPYRTQTQGTIPSPHIQMRSERNIYLGESFESVSRNAEKYLRCDVEPRAHEL